MATKKQKEPFFYILQPKINFPEANMQDVYSNREERKKKINSSNHKTVSEEINLEKADKKTEESNPLNQESEETTVLIEKYNAESGVREAETSEHSTKQHASSFNRVKRFKEMNTLERLDYLIHFPKQLPPVPCIYDTDSGTFRGILIEKSDSDIEIKLLNGKTVDLPIDTIKEVRMIGLKA